MVEFRLTVQVDEMVWTQVGVKEWMEARMKSAVETWREIELASSVGDAECVTLLG